MYLDRQFCKTLVFKLRFKTETTSTFAETRQNGKCLCFWLRHYCSRGPN